VTETKSHPATPTLTMRRRTYKLPHDVETTICWQTLLKLKISVKNIHYIQAGRPSEKKPREKKPC
jgi:hypothetical protein